MQKRAEIKISGFVQGVGFRSWAVAIARELGISGFVKNESDGSVKIVAEGEEEKLKKLIDLCWQGPRYARVKNVEVKWQKFEGGFLGFDIEY